MVIEIIVGDYKDDDTGEPFTLQYPVEAKSIYVPIIEDFLRRGFVLTLLVEEKGYGE